MQRNVFAGAPGGFTLLEVLVATAIFTVLVGALYSLFYGALRLRERTYEVTEASLPKDYIVTLIKRDLASVVPPVGILAGPMIGETEGDTGERFDSQLKAYKAAEEIYKREQRLAAFEEALQNIRKYVVVADPNDTQIFIFDAKEKLTPSLYDIGGFEETSEK